MSSEALAAIDKHTIEWAVQVIEGNSSFSLTEEKKGEIYALAFHLYREKNYQEASYFFRILTVSSPAEAKHWKGLGACFQMLKEYEEALDCYLSAQILYREQPDPYLYIHTADCYLALKQKEKAFKALEAARLCAVKKKDQRILKHIALMRDLWNVS